MSIVSLVSEACSEKHFSVFERSYVIEEYVMTFFRDMSLILVQLYIFPMFSVQNVNIPDQAWPQLA